jgi:hypothetical protein
MPKLCMPPMPLILCMPPMPPIDWAGNVAGAASVASMTAHPIVVLRSMTILPVVTPHIIVRTHFKMFKRLMI